MELAVTGAADRLRECERLIEVERKLPAILQGDVEPANAAECLQWAELCRYKGYHTAAAYYNSSAFRAEPKLAEDFANGYRYGAACDAVLAAAGKSEDAQQLPNTVRLMLRRQALLWLRATLAQVAKLSAAE